MRLAEVVQSNGKWKVTIVPDELSAQTAKSLGLPATDPATKMPHPGSRYVMMKLLERVNPKAADPQTTAKGRNLLVYVHGFNNDMEDVLNRASRLEALYGVEVLCFSWPANGGGRGIASYHSDKRDALASVGALDRVIAKIHAYMCELSEDARRRIEDRANKLFADNDEKWNEYYAKAMETWCPFTVSLMLHSMGNFVLKHLLDSSAYRGDLLVFDNIILAAADTNNAGHAEWVDRLQVRRRLFITINENDRALAASRIKVGDQQLARLGHYVANLNSRQAFYIDFTREADVNRSHAYFEDAVHNASIQKFFNEALNGELAEQGLHYNAATNTYTLTQRR